MDRGIRMSRGLLLAGVLAALTCGAGCRCFPGFACYADFIDDVGDDEWAFDQWYNPRLDISRAGRPDWCSPLNRKLGGCRCCGKPYWSWADCCWLYPGRNPYYYPGQVVPPPGMVMYTPPAPAASQASPSPPPAPVPQTVVPPAPMPQPPADPFEAAPPPNAVPRANTAPPLPAPPFPDQSTFQSPLLPNPPVIASPVFEPPLQ